jgi:hypothetical protein
MIKRQTTKKYAPLSELHCRILSVVAVSVVDEPKVTLGPNFSTQPRSRKLSLTKTSTGYGALQVNIFVT